jgi:hypothetical protein
MRRESEVASFILNRVLAHTEQPDQHSLQYRVVPAALFSGDVVFARRTPSGRLHVLLADAVGHGLPAAINILPLYFPFDAMSRKGYPISALARELNRRMRDLLPAIALSRRSLVSIDAEAGRRRGLERGESARPDGSAGRTDWGACRLDADGVGYQRRRPEVVRDAAGGFFGGRPVDPVFGWHMGKSDLCRRRSNASG